MLIWDPSPFRFCNNWLLSTECNLLIEETISNFTHHGWASFILHEQWRRHFTTQAKLKEKEKSLLAKLEICDAIADSIGLTEDECVFRSALQAELLGIYHLKERNLIQESKLNWLSVGDENSGFSTVF